MLSNGNDNRKFDLHLSAIRISRSSIPGIEEFGFARDDFANNTRCIASEYHATYRRGLWLPDTNQWTRICEILQCDENFIGYLEEEEVSPAFVCEVTGQSSVPANPFSPLNMMNVPPGKYKACDIHIGVDLTRSTSEAVECVESLCVASFDKPIPHGIRRVFSITCDDLAVGKDLYGFLRDRLTEVPGLVAKLKLEVTIRHYRHPVDAPTLPISLGGDVVRWLSAESTRK